MVEEFVDANGVSMHDAFQDWRAENQKRAVLTVESRSRARLHGSRCVHFGSGPPYYSSKDGLDNLTEKLKVCGTQRELEKWAKRKAVLIRPCQHCLRDGFIHPLTSPSPVSIPEEVPADAVYAEGSVERINVNRYERDRGARDACIAKHGTRCCICGFDFGATYGKAMAGYIHVHHVRLLSSLGPDYKVNATEDLRPVCPNCHAVLHSRKEPYKVDAVRRMLKRRGHQ